jgi:hypothetical protein
MSGIVRRVLLGAVLVPGLCLAAAGCTSSGGKKSAADHPSTGSSAASSAASAGPLPTAVPSLPATAPDSPRSLAAFMQAGLPLTGDEHLRFRTGLAGTSLTGQGDAVLSTGDVTGLEVDAAVSNVGDVHLLYVGGTGFAALPKPTAPGKRYTRIGGSAAGGEMDRVAIALQATQLLAAPATYRTLVAASQNLTRLADATIGATPVLHYRATVPVARIPSTDRVNLALTALGVTSLNLQVWLDGQGRPLKVAAPAPDGRVSDVTFSDINKPVHVAAPPAAQVDQ